MKNSLRVVGMFAVIAPLVSAGSGSGGTGGGVGGVTPPGAAEVRTLSERIPAGGTVQVKYLFTQPRPITTAGPRTNYWDFSVLGVSASSPLGDTAGAALMLNGVLSLQIVSPNGDYGTGLDYPFLTVAMSIPSTTVAGTTFPLQFLDGTFFNSPNSPTGVLALTNPKPGTLTIGGSVSINGIFPGGGTWGPGTVITIRGTGFVPNTKITTKMRTSTASYVSPTEMRFVLSQGDTMDSQPIIATNPDGSTVTFYSYLRGTPLHPPSRDLLRRTDPVFQTITHGLATVTVETLTSSQYMALAVQNPTPGPVVVSFTHQLTGTTTTVLLPSGYRVMDELSQLLGGIKLEAGDKVDIRSTSGVQMLGLKADDAALTMTPFLPQF